MTRICESLKDHYQNDLELIEKCWAKFDVCGNLRMESFYNENIEISDKYKRLKSKILSFDDIFSTDYTRIVVLAEAGYGKSTFVHEMARRWVEGEKMWTKRFLYLFLFRLGEVRVSETSSLKKLLTKCLSVDDAQSIKGWLTSSSNLKNCLFVFDGLDEFQHIFCEEINDLIFGRGIQHAHVVVTSRPSGRLIEQLQNCECRNLYIQLNGFTNEGVQQQLNKFAIKTNRCDMNNILKVPLFNTLFCITKLDSTVACLNLCVSIEKFVQFACDRQRKSDKHFTLSKVNDLILMLGKAAQNNYSFMNGIKLQSVKITRQLLSFAIGTGLVLKMSSQEHLVFAHHTIAEYCAAYFWFKTSALKVIKISSLRVYVDKPSEAYFYHDSLFSCFLSHFNSLHKTFLWKNFDTQIPILDEYESLPKRHPIINIWNSYVNETELFFKLACHSYRKSHPSFTETDESELILLLGQAMQKKFNFMRNTNTEYPKITKYILSLAVDIGLVEQNSTETNLVFRQYIYAAYCVAYFWWRTSSLKINRISGQHVHFADPVNGYCQYTLNAFLQFLAYFNPQLKPYMKNILETYFPDTTPDKARLYFTSHSASDQKAVLNKFDFSVDQKTFSFLDLGSVYFDSENTFETLKSLDCFLTLHRCRFKIGPEEFFFHYCVRRLILYHCTFYNCDMAQLMHVDNLYLNSTIVLEFLGIEFCDFTALPFFTYIMTHCTTLETLFLTCSFETESVRKQMSKKKKAAKFHFAGDAITALQNNRLLLKSIKFLYLTFDNPQDLTKLFHVLNHLVNLKKCYISMNRSLTTSEDEALSNSFEQNLKHLETLKLDFLSEMYYSFLRNLSKLCSLKVLEILNKRFSDNSIYGLVNAFTTLKLEECKLFYQEKLFNEYILKAIKFSDSLKKIKFIVDEKDEANFKLFENQILLINFLPDFDNGMERIYCKFV